MTGPRPRNPAPSARNVALAAADARMKAAKSAFSMAALSWLRGDADATAKTHAALALVDKARAALAVIADQAEE